MYILAVVVKVTVAVAADVVAVVVAAEYSVALRGALLVGW